MASGSIITLNLGTQTVGLATFSPAGSGGLRFDSFQSTEILADPSADSSRIPQVRLGVKELVDSAGVAGNKANYSLRGEAVFSRFVRLPRLENSKVRQIVEFEARQNVPFPLEDVYWDYQLVSRNDTSEVEVVLVAIKRDLLNDLNEAVEDSGLSTELVDIAPMALLNAFRFNYGEMDECSLLVDIGARTTNLVFIEPGLVFSRSVRSGGNSVTQAVAREFNEPFQAAEERKRRDGFVNLGGAYEDPSDPDVAALSKVIRNSMTKLHAEISRSIGFYRAQQKGSRPARIYLAGAGSSLPYMQEFFSEKFQLPVELFNPLRNVTLSSEMQNHPVLQHAHTIGELVGLALRDLGDCPMEINLQPATVSARKEAGSRRPFFIFAALALIAALAIWWVYLIQAQEVAAQKLDERTAQVSELQPIKRNIDEAQDRLAELQEIADPLVNVSLEREFWTGMLEDLNQNIPKRGIWITNIEPMFQSATLPVGSPEQLSEIIEDPTRAFGRRRAAEDEEETIPEQVVVNKIAVQGLVLEDAGRNIVYEFVANLINSDYFAITQENVNAPEIFQETPSPDGSQFAYSFMLELPLKKTLTVE